MFNPFQGFFNMGMPQGMVIRTEINNSGGVPGSGVVGAMGNTVQTTGLPNDAGALIMSNVGGML
jgi:hypothetical protein